MTDIPPTRQEVPTSLGPWAFATGLIITLISVCLLWGPYAAALTLGPLLMMIGIGLTSKRAI